MRTKKPLKKTLKSGGKKEKLSPAELEVLHYLADEYLTVKQIAYRRRTSVQAVYIILKKLRQKGVISRAYKKLEKTDSSFKVFKGIRLHGQELNIQILYKDRRYKKKIGAMIAIDGNTVRCYRDSIEVYSNTSFFGETVQHTTVKSIQYWNRFINRLEHELKIILKKPRAQNIRIVNHHYSEIDNEIAEEHEIKGLKLRVYATEDGKLWAEIDNSFNLKELETRHPQTAKRDAESVLRHLNDWRDHPRVPSLSELAGVLKETNLLLREQSRQNVGTAAGLKVLLDMITIMDRGVNNGKTQKTKRPEYIG